jgi:hypothetical protein
MRKWRNGDDKPNISVVICNKDHCQDFYRTWLYLWVTRRVFYKKQDLLILHPRYFVGVCFSNFFCVVLLPVFMFWVPCCDIRYDFRIKTMFGSSLPPGVCRRAHILFTLFVFVCVKLCPTHIVLCFCNVFHRLVYAV